VAQSASLPTDRQLPAGNQIFLDHVGHFIADPGAAAGALARAGFAPTPVSVQTGPDGALTGVGNITAMLGRGYIEALFKTAATPLGRELETAMARYPGLHLVAFAVADAAAAHRRLGAAGFRMQPLVEMQRPVDAGGHDGTAAFTIARPVPGEMPEGRIQLLTHRTEDMVWQPRWLSHPNGALGLTSLLIVAADLNEAADRFARFTGRATRPSSHGHSIDLDRGRIDLMTAEACAQMLPELPIPALPFIAAYEISVGSLDVVQGILSRNALASRRLGESLVVPFPEPLGHGAWLFTEAHRT
jgi:Glyoxalase-like domain